MIGRVVARWKCCLSQVSAPWLEVVSDEMQFGSLAVKLTGTEDDTLAGPDW